MKLAMRLGSRPQQADNDRDPREGESAEIIDLASRTAYPAVTQRKGRSDALEAECARLVALGARRVQRLEANDIDNVCIVMQDPEGNEFCLD